MMAIFSDLIENTMEVFMDDFSVYGKRLEECLENLDKVLKRCQETHLVLNWEKCHFMVIEGIVLGHRASDKEIEVDRAKIKVIEQFPPATNIKGVRSFLGHAGFYRRFIKDFSHIARPLTSVLAKETPFNFDEDCLIAFYTLKKALVSAPSYSLRIGIFHSRSCVMQVTTPSVQCLVNAKTSSIMPYPMLVRH
jgi:hypothetical protein